MIDYKRDGLNCPSLFLIKVYFMLRRFVEEVEAKSLFRPDDVILLAVSGGMDSVAFICFAPPGVPGGVSLC